MRIDIYLSGISELDYVHLKYNNTFIIELSLRWVRKKMSVNVIQLGAIISQRFKFRPFFNSVPDILKRFGRRRSRFNDTLKGNGVPGE
jgi:hypothetical protein